MRLKKTSRQKDVLEASSVRRSWSGPSLPHSLVSGARGGSMSGKKREGPEVCHRWGNHGKPPVGGDIAGGPAWSSRLLLRGQKQVQWGEATMDVWPEAPSPRYPPVLQLALRNALRYFPPDVQELLAPEFAQELQLYGHIYMYRFCPDLEMK